jgi:hypothetical protein
MDGVEAAFVNSTVMSDDQPQRILCPILASFGVIMYPRRLSAWVFRAEADGTAAAAQQAFDAHRCEDWPRDEGI